MDKLPVEFLALALLALSSIAVGDEPRAWPDLSDFDFVAGRAATKADIEDRRAVFLLQSDDVSAGIPLEIEIPQYAYHTNSETNERTAVVVVQAEELDGKKYVGAVTIGSRKRLLGYLWEFYLFGETPTNLIAGEFLDRGNRCYGEDAGIQDPLRTQTRRGATLRGIQPTQR